MSRIPPAVVDAVHERRAGSCEATGWPWLAVELHHRRPYRMGGRDDDGLQNIEENILAVCPRHHRWAHAHGTRDPHGFLLSDRDNPRDIPAVADPKIGRCGL